ncbi:40S ribosomal protein S10 [Anaeramoeba flamelloides]|uniref:40S ribosomal protein S10 n=1 Tax=Anaeramoeba flamelloides TaxID=1746091 RepID=A0AAV7Z1P6_9EUKA|nr:40S ribosomal protein S10 [Anaeramoeba flamelloides]
MIIAKKDLKKVYTLFFKAGVFVCKKDPKKKHKETGLEGRAIYKIMKSLRSRGLIEEQFNWQYYYWRLNNEGIEYLREYLHFPQKKLFLTHTNQEKEEHHSEIKEEEEEVEAEEEEEEDPLEEEVEEEEEVSEEEVEGGERGRGRGFRGRGRGYQQRSEGGYRPRNFGGRGQQRYNQQRSEEKN